jgi:hypothetical protein
MVVAMAPNVNAHVPARPSIVGLPGFIMSVIVR